MDTVTASATAPMVSHVRGRTNRLHDEPSSFSDCTDEADRTITTPVTSRMVTTAPRRTNVVRPAGAVGRRPRRPPFALPALAALPALPAFVPAAGRRVAVAPFTFASPSASLP